MENKNRMAKFLVIDSKADLKNPEIKEKIDAAEIVFVGLKLVKNAGSKVYDRIGTLMAKSEIIKAQRNFSRSEVEEISA